ncbi:hypothetical protein CHS0354_032591 [Potamilus streckersoni]|uniref:IGFBP N-terminal domain-containing protein n=1 Tax=Potamilus streckersoni TaxID=2493646 RepID=A0AAE0W9W4_9BIVA|nr:hypothetical protein CHS0354_032591 [Potamilus streckersoni]
MDKSYCGSLRGICNLIYIILSMTVLVQSLECPSCEKVHCSPRKASKLRCKGGVTTGVCDCCPTCAKVEGEKCGGDFNYLGKCDKGLYCRTILQTDKNYLYSRKEPDGICMKMPTPNDQPDRGLSACRPKCTPEFCVKHQRAICSAIDVAEIPMSCQGKCQHTSCKACKFVVTPSCRKCAKDDFRCMKKFGKCIKRDTCIRTTFPCTAKSPKRKGDGKFQCQVPECIDN